VAFQPVAFQVDAFQQSDAAPVLLGNIPNLRERQNTGTHQLDTSQYFASGTTYAIAPAIEAGWSFDTNTGLLTIDTDAVGTFGTYVVTATNANGDTPSNAFSVEVYAVTSEGGSAKPRKPRRHLVEIDGQYFDVADHAEAVALLEKAKSLATEVAEQSVERNVRRIKRGKQVIAVAPVITTESAELKTLVDSYREDIEAIYRQMAVDAEIRELMRQKFQDEDDEEAIFVLLH
jgi:hypothetical protein